MLKLSEIFQSISDALRYLLSGGMAILMVALIDKRSFKAFESIGEGSNSTLLYITIIISISFVTYILHRALLFPINHFVVMHYVKRTTYLWYYKAKRSNYDVHIPYAEIEKCSEGYGLINTLRITDLMTDIRLNRLQREANSKTVDHLSKHLERWASSVHGLYCCAWVSIVVMMLGYFGVFVSTEKKMITSIAISSILLIASWVHHNRFLKEELRTGSNDMFNNSNTCLQFDKQ